jgi:dipeptidase
MKRSSWFAVVSSMAATLSLSSIVAEACTTILVGKQATADRSVLMATSCDGDMMGLVYVVPAKEYAPGSKVEMFYDFPAPATWEQHVKQTERGNTLVGHLAVERTYRCVMAAGHLADSVTGGMNEHGVSMGIEYMGMRPELVNDRGAVSTCSNHWTSSLIANGLMRAKTAREAIELMGEMVEKYGFTYYWAPSAGCAIPIIDENEAWIMEVFGPGGDWKPDCGRPGAVWCAQRVPDGEATCSANRSRIGTVDVTNRNDFLASSNIFSLAEELNLWSRGTPFVWYDAYGVVGGRENSLREWAALNSLAPSLGLKATGDPARDRYPFSIKPDEKASVPTLAAVMRDYYQGTEFDVTERSAFKLDGKKSPLARPFGSPELFDLVDLNPERCIGSETSGYVYISQIRDWLPDPVAGCMWFAPGPSYTSCFTPIYSGTTRITDSWSRSPNFTRIDRTQVQWKSQLVEDLAGLRYQEAIRDVQRVYEPAEQRFLNLQEQFEATAVRLFEQHGAQQAEEFVTEYSNSCLVSVDEAYGALVDYLIFKYLYSYSGAAQQELVPVAAPRVPSRTDNEQGAVHR